MTTAVLLLAYGSPDSLADVPAYLLDVRGGRPLSPALLEEMTRRYTLIGGRSPLLDITRSAAAQLSTSLQLPVYVGMRHWRPYIRETVAQMSADGVQRCIAICMAPHYSEMSIGAYRARLDEAVAAAGNHLDVTFVESWHTQPDYLAGLAANVRETLARFPLTEQAHVMVIFTAHSLPASILKQGDPYPAQLMETASLLAERLGLPADRWTFSFQSAAQTGTPWLGPQIETLVPELARAGERNLLIAPVGFIADHAEVLYDLDIGVQEIARACGVRMERTPMLNDSPALVAALAAITREYINP
jgi:protoporphyrin/coproporphyrin ferrochelatase